jgi:ribosome recycling factor
MSHKNKLINSYRTNTKKKMEELLEDKGSTFSSIHTGRITADILLSGDKQRSTMASIW